jgi:xanthosine utilization system XapX-like protein
VRIVIGTIFGFLLGVGVAALLFSYAKIAVGTNAPAAIALVGAVIGLVIGAVAMIRRRAGSSSSSSEAASEA